MNEKCKKFLDDYGKLVDKHGVDFVTFPQFVPDGNGGFKIICTTQPVDLNEMKEAKRKEFMAKNV